MFIPDHNAIETPFYLYDLDLLDRTLLSALNEAARHGFTIHYAVKANHNTRLLRNICLAGAGADCVSGNEVLHSLEQGFDPSSIVFAGVGKTTGY